MKKLNIWQSIHNFRNINLSSAKYRIKYDRKMSELLCSVSELMAHYPAHGSGMQISRVCQRYIYLIHPYYLYSWKNVNKKHPNLQCLQCLRCNCNLGKTFKLFCIKSTRAFHRSLLLFDLSTLYLICDISLNWTEQFVQCWTQCFYKKPETI